MVAVSSSTAACLALLAAALRVVVAALTAWLAAGTLASTARRAIPRLRPFARLDRATLPIVRRALDLLFAASLGTGLVAAGATAAGAAPRPDVPVVRRPVPVEQPRPRPVERPPSDPSVSTPSHGPGPQASAVRHVVARGENLWVIASEALRARSPGPVSDRDVAGYWARVVAANRGHLRSSNPNLIFPGEVIELPA